MHHFSFILNIFNLQFFNTSVFIYSKESLRLIYVQQKK